MDNNYLSQLKMLYVEDDDNTREELKRFLKKKVGKVFTAVDGSDGLKKFLENEPDIIIADILMPGMNGMEMLTKIREYDPKCAFIITSTVDKTDTILEAVDMGIIKYVIKPINLESLVKTLDKVAYELHMNNAEEKIFCRDAEEKRNMESEIKKKITSYLKKNMGKGPRDMSIFIKDQMIEILVFDTLSQMERKILNNRHNDSIIEHLHRVFYSMAKEELEQIITDIIGSMVQLTDSEISLSRPVDKLLFKITTI